MTNLDIRSYHKGRTIYTNDFHYYAYTEFEHTAFELYAIKPNCLFFTHFRVTSESANTICKGPLTSARQIGIQRSELVVDNRTHQNKIDHMQQQMVENERSEVYTHTHTHVGCRTIVRMHNAFHHLLSIRIVLIWGEESSLFDYAVSEIYN